MDTLFPVEKKYPEGFAYYPCFLTSAEEQYLLEQIAKIDLHTFLFQGYEAKRKVASFGYDYSFDKRSLTRGKPIPAEFNELITKVSAHLSLNPVDVAELLITEYPVGSVINWHRDAPPFDIIAGISLQADCIFKLRPHEKQKQVRGSVISVPVERRSLYLIQGAARSDWQHSTAPVNGIRYSITLRTLREKI
jgi:alkylated DNA repair dioxygenase AlkB